MSSEMFFEHLLKFQVSELQRLQSISGYANFEIRRGDQEAACPLNSIALPRNLVRIECFMVQALMKSVCFAGMS